MSVTEEELMRGHDRPADEFARRRAAALAEFRSAYGLARDILFVPVTPRFLGQPRQLVTARAEAGPFPGLAELVFTTVDRRELMHERIRQAEAERDELREHARVAAELMRASVMDLTVVERALWRSTPAGKACAALEAFAGQERAA